jgi:hypothetical protein
MSSVSRQIECALTVVKLAIDESFADEDPIVLASIADIWGSPCVRSTHWSPRQATGSARTPSRFASLRLRQEMDRRLTPH